MFRNHRSFPSTAHGHTIRLAAFRARNPQAQLPKAKLALQVARPAQGGFAFRELGRCGLMQERKRVSGNAPTLIQSTGSGRMQPAAPLGTGFTGEIIS